MSSPRQERSRRTRGHILEVAVAAFARGGYEKTSLNEIVAASGVTKGAFYHHFASKEELALACFRYKQEELAAHVVGASDGASDAPAALRILMRERARLLLEDPSLHVILRIGAEFRVEAMPGSVFADYQMLAIDAFADLVRRGQAEGSFRSELDPAATGELIFAAMIGIDDVSRFLSGGEDLARRSEELVDLLLRGMAADGSAGAASSVRPRSSGRRRSVSSLDGTRKG